MKRKLKRECVEACLNCKKFVDCDDIGKFEECVDYSELGVSKQVVVVGLKEYCKLKS